MINTISKILKELRKKKKLTQAELAHGICTQAMISNFEKGESSPSSIVLYEISKKLDVDINIFFNEDYKSTKNNTNESINNTRNIIKNLIRNRDYEALAYIIEIEKEKENFTDLKDQQFLLWNEALCDFYLHKDISMALLKLGSALSLNKDICTEQDINIMNSIALIYFEIKEYEKSLDYTYKAVNNYKKHKITDKLLQIKLMYGLSRNMAALERFDEAILECKKAIDICVTIESLYLLGELYFQIARNLIIMDKADKSTQYLNKAELIFQIQNNKDYLNIIEQLKIQLYKE
ncbi:helix-turn-helix domain-containing protein [Viridibacillus sp. YIM B01967]|uniref:Helix-turn-helix domain-containing protein n=1 Tax=Viridibacillus soli TaxID=2798301 RepID=A0ABS1H320_9BACL|nr:helix-turn-helix domain-containing protein [Viridibacillus soli]MBK3493792.1 helix-turn-helix domain-containing protein [Viridibacillus soli]